MERLRSQTSDALVAVDNTEPEQAKTGLAQAAAQSVAQVKALPAWMLQSLQADDDAFPATQVPSASTGPRRQSKYILVRIVLPRSRSGP